MSSEALREVVAADAGHCCGYCRTPQFLINVPFELDHLRPRARGGSTTRENLWLSCRLCNLYKADRISATDPATGLRLRLFNPRRQRWERHFHWEGVLIQGSTPTGRATVEALRLNHPLQLLPRQVWLQSGLFPFPPGPPTNP